MAKSNISKWIVGLTGATLSAFVLSQVNGAGNQNQETLTNKKISKDSISKQEQQLVQLDWSNYAINGATVSDPNQEFGTTASDRQTSRS